MALALLLLPPAAALTAVRFAPASTVEVAGQDVSVRPVLGRDASRLLDGALVRPQHATVAGLDVGLDVDADWNQLAPSDKETRRYLLSLWENPRPALRLIRSAAQRHLVVWALVGFGAGTAVSAAVVLLRWRRRRRLARYSPAEVAVIDEYSRGPRVVATVLVLALVLAVDAAGVATYRHHDHVVVTPSSQLEGTALRGTQVTGLLADVLPFVSVLRPRSSFYDTVASNLERALEGPLATPAPEGAVTFVLAEDFEDVNGMARQVGLAARLVEADFIALSGDLTFAGKPLETYLLDTIDYYSDKLPVLFAPGLHDTPTVVRAAQVRGWSVADGEVVDMDGLRILAAADPRISTVGDLGAGNVLRDPAVDIDDFLARTEATACADRPDFVLLHDYRLGAEVARSGCAHSAVLDGRSFTFRGPQVLTTASGDPAVEYTSGSGGGHVTTRADPGIIRHPARFSVLRATPGGGTTEYAVVTVSPDAGVDVTPWRQFPVAG